MLVMTRDRPSGRILYTIDDYTKREYQVPMERLVPLPFKQPTFQPNTDIIQRILESFAIFQMNCKSMLISSNAEVDVEGMRCDTVKFLNTRIT